jgi:metallo-beta-lactamase family protein
MHLVEGGGKRVLLDAGLFQGLKSLRLRNRAERLDSPRRIHAVVLSHAHIDHSGYLPLLVRQGFRGPIHCTSATAELLGIMLRDAARLQEEEADRANRHGYAKHQPALPLYSLADVEATLALLDACHYGKRYEVTPSATALFRPAGHILGAATIELDPRVHSPADWPAVYSRMQQNMERMKVAPLTRSQTTDILLYLQATGRS